MKKSLLLPVFITVVCLVGDTSTHVLTGGSTPDFAMPAFASASHPEGSCRSSMQSISVTKNNTV